MRNATMLAALLILCQACASQSKKLRLKINPCVFDAEHGLAICADGTDIGWDDLEGWILLSPRDFEAYLLHNL
jgi:hypothetical protein